MAPSEVLAGRYRLVRVLTGRAGAARWLVRDEWADDREMEAVQVVVPTVDELSARSVRRVLTSEVGVAAHLVHPAVVPAVDVLADGDRLWVLTERAPTRTLATYAVEGVLSPARVARYGCDVAAGLAAAHAAGLVHRDIHAGLIGIRESDDAVLVGIATIGPAHPADPVHPAPELADGVAPSAASDVYALGMTLMKKLQDRMHELPGLVAVLASMTSREPAQRPSAAEVRHRLVQICRPGEHHQPAPDLAAPTAADPPRDEQLTTVDIPAPAHSRRPIIPPLPSDLSRRRRRSRGPIVLAMVIAMLGAIGLAVVIITQPLRVVVVGQAAADPAGWSASPSVEPPVSSAFGDPRTADPCSLLDATALASFGEVTVYPDYGWVSGCLASISTGDGGTIEVIADLMTATSYPISGSPILVGDFTVYRLARQDDRCDRVIRTPDGSRVSVLVTLYGESAVDLCAVSDVAVQSASTVLAAGGVERRADDDPPHALTRVDVCALLDPVQLGSVPGLDVRRKEAGFGGWRCLWGRDPVNPFASFVGLYVQNQAPFDSPPQQIGGRSVVVTPTPSTEDYCSLVIGHRAFAGSDGRPRLEVLRLHVYTGGSAEEACRIGESLVGYIAPKLPPSS